MDIQEHKATLLSWIYSCRTSVQLKLSEEAIEYFISKRFEKLVSPLEIAMVEADLGQAIRDKEKEIMLVPTVIAPTLERYNHINDVT